MVLPHRPLYMEIPAYIEMSVNLQYANPQNPGDMEMHHGRCMHFCGPKIAACMDTACGETQAPSKQVSWPLALETGPPKM